MFWHVRGLSLEKMFWHRSGCQGVRQDVKGDVETDDGAQASLLNSLTYKVKRFACGFRVYRLQA